MSSERWAPYAWLDDEALNDDLIAGCLGVVIGMDEATVRQQLAVDEGSRRDVTVHERGRCPSRPSETTWCKSARSVKPVLTFEPNGSHGAEIRPHARVVSRGSLCRVFLERQRRHGVRLCRGR